MPTLNKYLLKLIGGGLGAASLKVAGLAGFQTVSASGVFALPWLQVSVIYVEILLGLWFLFSNKTTRQWLAASTLFACFAAINLFQGLEGESSCGCFGPIRANPWVVFGVDLAVLGLLACLRPPYEELGACRKEIATQLKFMSGYGLILGVAIAAIALAFGSTDRITAFLRTEPYFLSPRTIDLGVGNPGDIKEVELAITNLSEKPLRVVGGTISCPLVAMADFPVTVEPGKSCTMRVRMSYPAASGPFEHTGLYYLDVDGLVLAEFQLLGSTNIAK